MMGQQSREESLFYSFRLEDQIPETHLLRLIDRYVDFTFVRDRLKSFYSPTGRPSIDPETLLRLLFRALVGTPAYERSRRARYQVEALFAELKQRLRVDRVRLRRLWNVAKQFHLAATAQNLKRLVQFLARGQPGPTLSTT